MIQLFDRENVHQVPWPDTLEARQAKGILVPMMENGVESYIENVRTNLYLVLLDSHIFPITVNETEYENSYVASNYYFIQMLREEAERKGSFLYPLKRFFIQSLGQIFKGMKINKMVMVNNWLLTSTIYPNLTEGQLLELTQFLTTHFSDHLIIFRNLEDKSHASMLSSLKELNYRSIMSRYIFIYDQNKKNDFSSKVNYHHRRDRRLIQAEGYQIILDKSENLKKIPRLIQLYRNIYHEKHTSYSPSYTNKYLQLAIEQGFLKIVTLKKEEEIDGVLGFFQRENAMLVPFFGYDTEKEVNHLYRILTQMAIDEAESQHLLLNDGSGGEKAKLFRGLDPVREFVAVYDRHLPFYRRFFWSFSEKMVEKITAPLLAKKLSKMSVRS